MKRVRILMAIAAAAMVAGLYFTLTSPTDRLQGEFTRIVNIHAPSMWVAFLAFGVTALASILWLISKQTDGTESPRHPWRPASCSPLPVSLPGWCGDRRYGAGPGTGPIRAWHHRGRCSSSTSAIWPCAGPPPTLSMRARRSAILGAIAVVQVPLVYFSVNLFRSLHQTQSIRPDGVTMPDEMVIAILVNFLAFTFSTSR